jgi:hypothetical protein
MLLQQPGHAAAKYRPEALPIPKSIYHPAEYSQSYCTTSLS